MRILKMALNFQFIVRGITAPSLLCLLWILGSVSADISAHYVVDATVDFGRRFDGIGAISGGGATSKLLVNYPEKQRNEILDFLFKPNYGASLQILKVEIGGDVQSTEGTEASHMHEEWDENYERGYEWWMMVEAKKRNKHIKLCALPWGFPAWLGENSWYPYSNVTKTADYIFRWIWGAKKYYNLDIDCVGIWNEKPYDIKYIKTLRKTLDERGFKSVRIVAADMLPSAAWNIAEDMKRDKELNASIDIIGGHYSGSYSSPQAQNSGKPIWSSEDWSDSSGETGAGCLARLVNQNYIQGYMTSYYDGLPITYHGLMQANEPWSGYYDVSHPIWAAAHTTWFTEIGWHYLQHKSGVGELKGGGTYVTLVSPDKQHMTIIIETMDTSKKDFCLRPPAIPTEVVKQTATFILNGTLGDNNSMNIWRTLLKGNGSSEFFTYMGNVLIQDDHITLTLERNAIYTITSVSAGQKPKIPDIPPSKPFPIPYSDDMNICRFSVVSSFTKYSTEVVERRQDIIKLRPIRIEMFNSFNHISWRKIIKTFSYPEYKEADNFAQQVGAFEIRQSNDPAHGKVMRQVVLNVPIHWCPFLQAQPVGVIGNYNWVNVSVEIDILVPSVNGSRGVLVGARMDQGGCTTFLARGIFFFILFDTNTVVIASDLSRTQVIEEKSINVKRDQWYHLTLTVKGDEISALLNDQMIYSGHQKTPSEKGFVALGSDSFGLVDFDNLKISPP